MNVRDIAEDIAERAEAANAGNPAVLAQVTRFRNKTLRRGFCLEEALAGYLKAREVGNRANYKPLALTTRNALKTAVGCLVYAEKVVISLRDATAQSNLWEIVQIGQDVRLTRFPKLRSARIESPFGNRSKGRITPEIFTRIVAAHRSAIVSMIRNRIALLVEERTGATSLEQEIIDDRLREMQGGAAQLFPMEFPG